MDRKDNNFTKIFKDKLYDAVGGKCPLCSRPTVAIDPLSKKRINVGEATLIYDAIQNNSSTRKQPLDNKIGLNSFENGLWLCRSCHKITHDNPTEYTSDILFRIKHKSQQANYDEVIKVGVIVEVKSANEECIFKECSKIF